MYKALYVTAIDQDAQEIKSPDIVPKMISGPQPRMSRMRDLCAASDRILPCLACLPLTGYYVKIGSLRDIYQA